MRYIIAVFLAGSSTLVLAGKSSAHMPFMGGHAAFSGAFHNPVFPSALGLNSHFNAFGRFYYPFNAFGSNRFNPYYNPQLLNIYARFDNPFFNARFFNPYFTNPFMGNPFLRTGFGNPFFNSGFVSPFANPYFTSVSNPFVPAFFEP